MSNQQLTGDAQGIILLKAGDKEYVCTDLQWVMSINELPTAVVTIGSGYTLRDAKKQAAEELLKDVLNRRNSAYTDMIECEILEKQVQGIAGSKDITIFKGCIVTGTTIYRAGSRTVRAIRFLCMNSACKLMARPMSEFLQVECNTLINYVGAKSQLDAEVVLSKANIFRQGRVTAEFIYQEVASKISTAKIHDRLSYIVDSIVNAGSYVDHVKETTGTNVGVSNYITSDHSVNAGLLGDISLENYNKELCTKLFQLLTRMSILDSIKTLVTSEDFMLQLTPQFDSDFKLKVEPSAAWVKAESIVLNDKHISGIDSNYNPIACINTPEAFIVNYAPAVSMLQNEQARDYLGANGVFAMNSELDGLLKQLYQGKTPNIGAFKDKLYRARVYNAPKWLYPAFAQGAFAPGSTPQSVAGHKRKESSEDGDETKVKTVDIPKANALANEIAKALFTLLYGSHDTSTVTLLPSLRFGKTSGIELEKHLGKPVDIELTESGHTPLSIRGILTRVAFSYSSSDSSMSGYSISLTRVRPLDKSEQSIECPLYVKQ